MQKNGKEIWVEEAMGSIDNIQRAAPLRNLYTSIEHRLHNISRRVPLKTVGMAAACMLLLLAVNFLLLSQPVHKKHTDHADEVQQVVEYYGLNRENDVF